MCAPTLPGPDQGSARCLGPTCSHGLPLAHPHWRASLSSGGAGLHRVPVTHGAGQVPAWGAGPDSARAYQNSAAACSAGPVAAAAAAGPASSSGGRDDPSVSAMTGHSPGAREGPALSADRHVEEAPSPYEARLRKSTPRPLHSCWGGRSPHRNRDSLSARAHKVAWMSQETIPPHWPP